MHYTIEGIKDIAKETDDLEMLGSAILDLLEVEQWDEKVIDEIERCIMNYVEQEIPKNKFLSKIYKKLKKASKNE